MGIESIEFPKDWCLKELGGLCEINGRIGFRGYTVNDIVDEGEGAITLSPSNINNGKMNLAKCTYLSWKKYDESPEIQVQVGDILLVKTGSTVGKVATVLSLPQKATVNPQIVVLKKAKIPHGYLGYQMNFKIVQNQLSSSVVGGALPTLSQKQIAQFRIPLPPTKTEQEAIANALSDADAFIDSLEKLIAKKRLIKKGAMRVLLDGTVQGSEPVRLSSVCWFQEGPGVRTHQFTSSGIKLLNGTNIKNGVLDLDVTTRFIGESEAYGPYRHFLADEGDIVIASSGITVDRFHEKVAIVKPENLPLCMNTSTIRFKPNEQLLDRRFLFQYLMSEDFKTQIGGQATGSAQLNFGPYHLNRIYIKLPTIEHQLQAAQVLNDLDLDISNLDRKIAKARSIKHGMMQELLTGRIRLI